MVIIDRTDAHSSGQLFSKYSKSFQKLDSKCLFTKRFHIERDGHKEVANFLHRDLYSHQSLFT